MATAEQPLAGLVRPQAAVSTELADQWRRLTRAATVVALLTSPALFIWFKQYNGWSTLWSLLATLGVVIVFRGFADLIFRKLIPWPSLFGADSQQLRDEDVIGRRRAWYWRKKARFAIVFGTVITVVWLIRGGTWWGTVVDMMSGLLSALSNPAVLTQVVFVIFLFIANFAILMGPMLMMGISQIRGFEPGDAQWGVKLEDVRGQAEAKEEVRRVVTLWQSGEAFEQAGGKRERGLLFLGAPGTGKTMLAKAIATGFNSPFVSIPGSGFAQTFIGIDAIIVRYLAAKAKKLATQVGRPVHRLHRRDRRGRHAPAGARRRRAGRCVRRTGHPRPPLLRAERSDHRERRPDPRDRGAGASGCSRSARPSVPRRTPASISGSPRHRQLQFPGRWAAAAGAGAEPAARRDGRDRQPAVLRSGCSRTGSTPSWTRSTSSRAGSARCRLRLPAPGPRGDQIYFIGATNVPLERLDPALIRPGRMGRHVWFRTPTKQDRLDIFDLYLDEGRARARARHARAPRRDRTDHERLLAGDDRPGLLDGADHRPPRRSRQVRAGRTSSRR